MVAQYTANIKYLTSFQCRELTRTHGVSAREVPGNKIAVVVVVVLATDGTFRAAVNFRH